MPQFTINIPDIVALRVKTILDYQGHIGTPAEQLAMVKKESITFLIRWLKQAELEMQTAAAAAALVDPEIT